MIRLIRSLFATPEAERDPSAWASRLFAHMGVGLVGWVFFALPLGPWGAVAAVALLYAIWETGQSPRSWRMAWDGALDWCAVVVAVTAAASIWDHSTAGVIGCGATAVIICAAGVWRRS